MKPIIREALEKKENKKSASYYNSMNTNDEFK